MLLNGFVMAAISLTLLHLQNAKKRRNVNACTEPS